MIVITGPGRSGTSFLARLYQELGFSPIAGGGGWDPDIRGGLEDKEIGELNGRLINALGMHSSVRWVADPARRLRARLRPRSAVPVNGQPREAKPDDSHSTPAKIVNLVAAKTLGRHVPLLRWERMPMVIERYGAEMRRLAAERQVVKDPAFSVTLGAWAAAGAGIEYVVVSLRAIESASGGLLRTGHLPPWASDNAKNHVAYRLGLLLAALTEHRLRYGIVRFPDFLDDGDALYDALQFPTAVPRERVLEVLHSLRDPQLVSSWK